MMLPRIRRQLRSCTKPAERCKYFKASVTQPDEAHGLVEKAALGLHFALSMPNFLIQEGMLTDVPWRRDVVQHSLETREGYWLKTESIGIGISVNKKEAAKHSLQQEVIRSINIRANDGAVLDCQAFCLRIKGPFREVDVIQVPGGFPDIFVRRRRCADGRICQQAGIVESLVQVHKPEVRPHGREQHPQVAIAVESGIPVRQICAVLTLVKFAFWQELFGPFLHLLEQFMPDEFERGTAISIVFGGTQDCFKSGG